MKCSSVLVIFVSFFRLLEPCVCLKMFPFAYPLFLSYKRMDYRVLLLELVYEVTKLPSFWLDLSQ
jgi:hypothetical protein